MTVHPAEPKQLAMKNIVVRLVLIFMTVFMTADAATIVWFTGPGFISGGNTYEYKTPYTTGTVFLEVSGNTANNLSLNFSGGASVYVRTATTGNAWQIGHTYRSTDGLGGNVEIAFDSPSYKSSNSSMSSWEFTVLEADWFTSTPDVFAVNGSVTDLNGQKTWFAVRRGSSIPLPTVPEPSITILGLLASTLALRRRR